MSYLMRGLGTIPDSADVIVEGRDAIEYGRTPRFEPGLPQSARQGCSATAVRAEGVADSGASTAVSRSRCARPGSTTPAPWPGRSSDAPHCSIASSAAGVLARHRMKRMVRPIADQRQFRLRPMRRQARCETQVLRTEPQTEDRLDRCAVASTPRRRVPAPAASTDVWRLRVPRPPAMQVRFMP